MALKLIVGNKNYSSWSFRPWSAMKVAGIPFEEKVISLNADDFKQRVSKISGTGKVPALADGSVQVWESLAILEYLAERFPAAGLWPADAAVRARQRADSGVGRPQAGGGKPLGEIFEDRQRLPDLNAAVRQRRHLARARNLAHPLLEVVGIERDHLFFERDPCHLHRDPGPERP